MNRMKMPEKMNEQKWNEDARKMKSEGAQKILGARVTQAPICIVKHKSKK